MKLYYNQKKDTYINGFLLGFFMATIIWCIIWPLVIGEINQGYETAIKQYIIEQKQK